MWCLWCALRRRGPGVWCVVCAAMLKLVIKSLLACWLGERSLESFISELARVECVEVLVTFLGELSV